MAEENGVAIQSRVKEVRTGRQKKVRFLMSFFPQLNYQEYFVIAFYVSHL
jgi:hypothetical protein